MVENPVGVWIKDGWIFRSDIGELPRIYRAREPRFFRKAFRLVCEIQQIGTADQWTRRERKALDRRIKKLKKIAIF